MDDLFEPDHFRFQTKRLSEAGATLCRAKRSSMRAPDEEKEKQKQKQKQKQRRPTDEISEMIHCLKQKEL